MNEAAEQNTDWLMSLFNEPQTESAVAVKTPAVKQPSKTTCNRCSGSGRISYFSHVKAGVCFRCNGTGH